MKRILFISLLTLTAFQFVYFQGNTQSTIITDVNTYTTPKAGAVLDVHATDKGVSIPNVALTQLSVASPVSSPVTGLLVYNTATAGTNPDNVTPGFYYWTGAAWSKLLVGGNASGNITIEADGTLIFNGDATGWEDLRVPGLSAKAAASQPPTFGAFGPSGNLLVNLFGGGSSINSVYFNVQMPHSWKEGSTIYPHIHWSPSNTSAGNVKWNIEYSWANYGAVFPAPTTTSVTQAANLIAWEHQIASISGGITATGKTISSILMIRLFRDPNDAADTYGSDAAFLDFDIHYEINSVGSRTEFTK